MCDNYRSGTGSQVITTTPAAVSSILVTGNGGGKGILKVRDGDSVNADIVYTIKAPASETQVVSLPERVWFDDGLYVECDENIARWTVGYRIGKEV